MTVEWVLNGMKMPVEKLAYLMVEAMPSDLKELFLKIHLLQND